MQDYHGRELVGVKTGTMQDLARAIDEMDAEITHRVIGRIPADGTRININGLMWIVERSSGQHGWMRLRLATPNDNTYHEPMDSSVI